MFSSTTRAPRLRHLALTGLLLGFGNLFSLAQTAVPAVRPDATAWPSPLVLENGAPVLTREAFEQQRRPELLTLFAQNVYGKTPQTSIPIRVTATQTDPHALNGLAIRKQITLAVGPNAERTWHLLLYVPAHATKPVPVVIGLNFDGNHTVDADPGIDLNPIWIRDPALASTPLAKELSRYIQATDRKSVV